MEGGSTKLVNSSPEQPADSFFHYPKMPSYLKQQFPKSFRPVKRNQEPYTPMAQRDYHNYDGKRPRSSMRRAVDYSSSIVRQLEARIWQRDERDQIWIQPDPSYVHMTPPPSSFTKNVSNAITTKFVHCSTNKVRCPVFCVVWTPEGRRLVTGASSGEFTLWNGLTFNFETILQAHDYAIRSMCWSHNDLWLLSGDDMGYVKYWQSNMNNVQMFQAHKDQAIRGVSFAPTDSKFASCSDDGTVRVWDFLRCHEERIMRGHGADVRCVDWHQQKGLIVSGSKDSQQPVKLWDPRSGNPLTTIHAHKGTVMAAKFSNNGNWLVTASRDHLCKVFDLRVMKEMCTFRGHKKEATSLALHPIHEDLFVTGGSDGSILFWQVGHEREIGSIDLAHDSMVWGLSWHPLGHMLCSGSNDHTSKFWSRNRPGDKMRDRYNLNTLPIGTSEELREYDDDSAVTSVIPGMGLEITTQSTVEPFIAKETSEALGIPGLDSSADEIAQITPLPQRKVPFARPVPSDFQKEWESKKAPGIAPDLEEQDRLKKEKEETDRKRKSKQRDEEERMRRKFEREKIRKREKEYKEQKDKEDRKKDNYRAEEEMMDQGSMIPGFGPDGPSTNFPMPRSPPPSRLMRDHGSDGPDDYRGPEQRSKRRRSHIKDEWERQSNKEREPREDDRDRERRRGGPRRSGRDGPKHHGKEGSRHPEKEGPRHPDMEGPRPSGMEGQGHSGMKGRRHPEMMGPRPGMMGPRYPGMEGPQHPGMMGPRPPGMMGPWPPEMEGPHPGMQGHRHSEKGNHRMRGLDSGHSEEPGRGGSSSGPMPLMSLVLGTPSNNVTESSEPPDEPNRGVPPPPHQAPQHQSSSQNPKRDQVPPQHSGGPKPLIPGLTSDALLRGDVNLDSPGMAPPNHQVAGERDFDKDIDYRHSPGTPGRAGPPRRDGPPHLDETPNTSGPSQSGRPNMGGFNFDSEHSNAAISANRFGLPPQRGRGRGGPMGSFAQADRGGESGAGVSPGRGRGGMAQGDSFRNENSEVKQDMDMRQHGLPQGGGPFQDEDERHRGGPWNQRQSEGFDKNFTPDEQGADDFSSDQKFKSLAGSLNARGTPFEEKDYQGRQSRNEGPGKPMPLMSATFPGSPMRGGRGGMGQRGGGSSGGGPGPGRGAGQRGRGTGRGMGRGNRGGRGGRSRGRGW